MEMLTWAGSLSFLNPIFSIVAVALIALFLISFLVGQPAVGRNVVNADGTVSARGPGLAGLVNTGLMGLFALLMLIVLAYLVVGAALGTGAGIIGGISQQLIPVWGSLISVFTLSIVYKRRLGLYGKLFDSVVGMIGFGIVLFWVFVGVFGAMDLIVTHDPLSQVSGMKNEPPGTPLRGAEDGEFMWYLLGGDNLARDVFSRMVAGAWVVVQIAPLATLFAFMVGITLGLPAGYYGGTLDVFLSFLANLILAFPVILLFYLLVTPEIVLTGLPQFMAAILFFFPLIFLGVLIHSRYRTQPSKNYLYLALTLIPLFVLYASAVNAPDSKISFLFFIDLFDIAPGILVVFVSVVFVNSPTVFRIVRGLTLDIKTRDYVAAAQTRGERPWYVLLLGPYEGYSAASQQLAELPVPVKVNGPWIRRVGKIQSAMR